MDFKQFCEKLASDEALKEQFKACADLKAAYEFAKSIGLTLSFEEFSDEMTKITEAVSALSDEDLEAVSGGSHEATWLQVTVQSVTQFTCV